MSHWPVTLLILFIGIAGWYYLFYSRAAKRLIGLESDVRNGWRLRLRKFNGMILVSLAALLYIATRAIDWQVYRWQFVGIWLVIVVLLFLTIFLALIDIRLTAHLRSSTKDKGNSSDLSH